VQVVDLDDPGPGGQRHADLLGIDPSRRRLEQDARGVAQQRQPLETMRPATISAAMPSNSPAP
jgi:hypothetical protein